MPVKSSSYLVGYSTSSLTSLNKQASLLNRFFKQRVNNYFIFGDYDILSIAPIDNELDLLSRKFSSFYINRENDKVPGFQHEDFETHSIWVELVDQNEPDVEDLFTIGVIRIKLYNDILKLNEGEVEKKLTRFINDDQFKKISIKLYRSYAWDEYQLFIESNSFADTFAVTKELNKLKVEIDKPNLIKRTQTILGFKLELLEKEGRKKLALLNENDKLGFSIQGISPEAFKTEKDVTERLQDIIGIYRVAGKVDFFLYPRQSGNEYLLSTKNLLQKQLALFDLIVEEKLNLKISTSVYQQFPLEKQISGLDTDNRHFSNTKIEYDRLHEFYEAMRSLKVATQERASITFLINNFNRYSGESLITHGISELYEPIDAFIKKIISYKDQTLFAPHKISQTIKDFTNALKQAIENRLHGSQRFERANDIFISTKCGFTDILSCYNSMCSHYAQFFGIKGFLVHFDYDCHLRISDQSLNLNLYNIVKPELFCSLIGAEMFNLFLQEDSFNISHKYEYFNEFSDFRNPGESLNRFKRAIEGESLFSFSALVKYTEDQSLDLINKSFVDHIYMDIFNYLFIFSNDKELFGFWYWASFLMDSKSLNSSNTLDETNLQTRMLRYEIVQEMLGIINCDDQSNIYYPRDFDELNPQFDAYRPAVNKIAKRIADQDSVIFAAWIDQVGEVFKSIEIQTDLYESGFRKYLDNKLNLLTGIKKLYDKDRMKFSYSGALVSVRREESDMQEVNDLRVIFLKNLFEIAMNDKREKMLSSSLN